MESRTSLLELGRRMRAAREARGWSQEEFAHKAALDRSYVGGVERGQRNLTFTVLCQIAAALGTDVAALTTNLPQPRQ